MSAIDPTSATPKPVQPAPQQAASDFSFGHLLRDLFDVVNPLEHIPVISTLYRHLTGHEAGTAEQIMGDTLYGGPIGFVCSLGNTIFQAVTGKDVGDTVYAYLTGSGAKTDVASQPAVVEPAAATNIVPPDLSALTKAMSNRGVDSDLARRAAYAYSRAVGLAAY